MKKYAKITPEGTKDFLFEECDAYRTIETSLSKLFKMRGYHKVITPGIEFYDVFNRESGSIPLEEMYKLTDSKGRLLVLRADNTMPIARVAATRLKEEAFPLRLYYNQKVYRQMQSFSGLSDEKTQSGIELIGASGIRADLEVLCLALDALKICGANEFRLEIGHAGFFRAICNQMHVEEEQLEELVELIESKNFSALHDLLEEMEDTPETNALKQLPRLFGGKEILDIAKELYPQPEAQTSLAYLRELYSYLEELGVSDKISIDLGLVHRRNYYTGALFRGYIEGSGVTVVSGGRYDNLIEEFGMPMPATGFGVEVDALASILLQQDETGRRRESDILVFGKPGSEMKALQYIGVLTGKGFQCENSLEETVEASIAYGKRRGMKRLDIVSGDTVSTIEI